MSTWFKYDDRAGLHTYAAFCPGEHFPTQVDCTYILTDGTCFTHADLSGTVQSMGFTPTVTLWTVMRRCTVGPLQITPVHNTLHRLGKMTSIRRIVQQPQYSIGFSTFLLPVAVCRAYSTSMSTRCMRSRISTTSNLTKHVANRMCKPFGRREHTLRLQAGL